MKPVRFFIVLALLILFPLVAQAAMVGNVTHVTGRVDITSPGETAMPANVGDEVNQDDIIRTKSNSKAEITFLDGNILRLAEETRVEIAEYMIEEEQVTGVLNLFRGKLQNIVSTIGKEFGRDKQNHFEVHTPTAVCGVRGTNFFPWFQKGVSGATFQEGDGYVYSKNRPDEVKTIHAGQTSLVVSADQPPMVRPATDEEMGGHIDDTFPSDDDDGDDEGDGEGEGEGEGEGYSPPDDEGLGEPEGGDDTTPPPPPPPYIPPDIPPEGPTATYTDFSSLIFGFPGEGDSATLSGSINDDTNEGTLSLSGSTSGFAEDTWESGVSADLSDGSALEGDLLGISGTWEGLLASIYVNSDGGAGYIYGDLSGDYDPDDGTFDGSGSATRSPILGYTDITTDGLAEALASDGWDYPVPILGSIDVGWAIEPDSELTSGIMGIETNSGRLLGVWGATTGGEGGFYANELGLATWYGIYGDADGDYYMLGVVSGTDDSAGQTLEGGLGHVDISGGLYYLDPFYQGYISLEYRGTYDAGGSYESIGAGTYTLDPLAFSGDWEGYDSLYYNDEGDIEWGGYDYGLIGGLTAPWDGPADFLAMGDYYYDEGAPGGPYIWTSEIYAEGEDGGFGGITGGIWKDGAMKGAAVAIYGYEYTNEDDEVKIAAGILTADVSGNYYEDLDMWMAEGTLTPEEMATDLNSDVYPNWGGLYETCLAGHFGSAIISGEIYGEWPEGPWEEGVTCFYDDSSGTSLPWGIYGLMLGYENYYDGKPLGETEWSAVVGGYGGFDNSYEGYWLATVDGIWKEEMSGEITGDLAGRYLTPLQMGTIQGPFFGLYTEDEGEGTWIGESLGTFEGDPLAFSGYMEGDPDYNNCGLAYNVEGNLVWDGGLGGNIGGLTSPWDEPTYFLAMGDYYEYGYGEPYIWTSEIYGWDTATEGELGGFDGITGGIWKDGAMKGAAVAIYGYEYTNEDDEVKIAAGILTADVLGNYYEDLEMWMAQGTLTPIEMGRDLDPEDIYMGEPGEFYLEGDGSFDAGETYIGVVGIGSELSIIVEDSANQDQGWGIWGTVLGGEYYADEPSNDWSIDLASDEGNDLNIWARVDGSQWSAGEIAGKVSGAWVDLDDAMTGVMGGELIGCNPTETTWQAVAAGSWIETSRFLGMAAVVLENGDPVLDENGYTIPANPDQIAMLNQLNIPCIEVGRTDLSGSGDNLTNVYMNNVAFFAYSTGAMPRIWATGDVSGSYSANPLDNTAILHGTGFNDPNGVRFTVNNWGDTVGENWGAIVDGSGTVSGNPIDMNGAAAGTIVGEAGADVGFTGTGAGVASPTPPPPAP